MDFCNNFSHDLKVGQVKEIQLAEILEHKTIEVKHDLIATKTGNLFIEYESRGKPSGISKSNADYYCLCFGDTYAMIKTENLKKLCRKHYKTKSDVLGGDNNTSKGILLPIYELFIKI